MNQRVKERIAAAVDRALPQLKALRDELYRHPEIGGEEAFASSRLTEVLAENGFQVSWEYGGIPHAFRAAVSAPAPGPTVALFAEYDALPELGHACGHNLICAAALGAALALRAVLEELRGTVVVFGTPGEENLCTKTTFAERGLLDEADAAMMVHPNPVTCASGRTRAVESLQVEFFGRSAHAGTGDQQGINALDAAVACYQRIQTEKARCPDTNVHGILNDGGQKASVIPGYSSLKYLTRAWDMEGLRALRTMVERCAAAAAAETGCTYRIHNNEATNRPMLTNERLSQVFNRYLLSFGESELLHQDVTGSTDMGDVSWRIPAIHPWVGLHCPEIPLHTEAFAEKTLSPEADAFLSRCSGAMACTAAEILTDAELLTRIQMEFERSRKP